MGLQSMMIKTKNISIGTLLKNNDIEIGVSRLTAMKYYLQAVPNEKKTNITVE